MKKKSLMIIGIIVAISVVTGISYALWKTVLYQSEENIVTSSCFDITFEETEGIYLTNSIPIYDEEGRTLKPYKVTVTNHCDRKVDYQVNFETTSNTTLKDQYIKLMVNEKEPVLLSEIEETSPTISNGRSAYKIETGVMEGNSSKEYEVRIWMDEKVTQNDEGAMNGLFEGKITIIASYIKTYTEEILNGMDPVLKDGLIPVTIGEDGTVYRANLSDEWYRYGNQKWANAVILEDESQDYFYNEEIPEEAIESYFVWIPRYQYKIFNLGNYTSLTSLDNNAVQTIDIVFGDTVTDDANEGECTTPMTSGATGNCKVGDYMSHPAFLTFDVKGLWVGKFETGYKGATNVSGAQKNENNPDKIQIKPNIYSWRNISIANAHLNSYNYKREYDSHMIKNTEWGAVAYLQHSVYGSRSSVRINNNSNYITGYASKNEPTTGYTGTNATGNKYEGTTLGVDGTYTYNYKNLLSVVASTTNNYSGVYDMSGGIIEYVMGVVANTNGVPCAGREAAHTSGFAGPYCYATGSASGVPFPEEKYYDKYQYSTSETSYNRRILGDAIGEMGSFAKVTYGTQTAPTSSWYRDESYSSVSGAPWTARGGNYSRGVGAGVFAGGRYAGTSDTGGFRIILAF